MDMVAIAFFVLLELTILLGLAVFFVNRKRRQLQRRLDDLQAQQAPAATEEFESIASGYLPYLEKQIIESRDKIESTRQENAGTPMLAALDYRLSLLQAEKQLSERCNDYPEKRWEHVAELFVPPAEPGPEQAADEPADTGEKTPQGNEELAKAQQRIKRLEKFRDHFFAMKGELKSLETNRQKLADQLDALLPEAERSAELAALLEDMNAQRDRLQGELDQLEAQSEQLARSQGLEVREETNGARRIDELNDVMGQQGDAIASLKDVVTQVMDEPSAAVIADLEKQVQQLERRYQEASDCLQIMNEENERLQDKVDRKEQRIERMQAEQNESVADLAEQVEKQKTKMSELHGMVDDLQLEAEKAEQLQAKLDQFDLASRDMNMCIQVLEEENQFLQEQIKALLQMDESGSIYDADTGDSASLEQKIDELQALIEEKDARIKEVEARYASMEQEYLTLYEEANS